MSPDLITNKFKFRSSVNSAYGSVSGVSGQLGGLLGTGTTVAPKPEQDQDIWSKTANTMFPLTATWGVKNFER